jgi:periplasmic copper chaperone A
MHQHRAAAWLTILGLVLGTGLAQTATAETGAIAVEKAWTRATPKGAKVAAGYLTIRNHGDEPDRLLGGRAEFAGKTEIHLMNMVDGVMQMRPVRDGLQIMPNSTVALEPSGYHLMFMELARPLAEGETVSGALNFERAGEVPVSFAVMGLGAQGPDAEDHQHHHH